MTQLPLEKLKAMVSNAADLTSSAREMAERDRDYTDHHQYTAEEIAVLRRRKQPIVTNNHIRRKVDAMVGMEQRGRVDPKAFPRTPQHLEQAELATKALIFVDDNCDVDSKRSQAFENLIVEGTMACEVIVQPKRDKLEVCVNRIRWEELVYDPHSRELDFSDAGYLGTMKWMTLDEAVSLYGGVYEGDDLEEVLMTVLSTAQDGETYEDRPIYSNSFRWADKRQRRVRVAQLYYRHKGEWNLAIFCGGGVIWEGPSPYYDDEKKPCCAIIAQSAYIDRENDRYGVVRSMISPQDEINKRRSKALHLLSSRQTVGVKGALDSVTDMKREMADPSGHVEVNIEAFEDAARVGMKPFEVQPTGDMTAGHVALLQEAKQEIDALGPNPSLQGEMGSSASGRAILAQQQAGMTQLGPIYDGLRHWNVRLYRAIWSRIQQFWTEQRWVRVTDDEGAPEFFGFNVVQGNVFDMTTGHPVPVVANNVAEMDVDIIVDASPDYATLQHEQFATLADLAGKGIAIPPEMLIEASALPDKAKYLKKIKEREQASMAQQGQMMQAQAQMEGQKAQAAAQRDMAAAQKDGMQAQKIAAEVDETRADTAKTVVETQRLMLGA